MLVAGGEQAMGVYYEIMASVGGRAAPLPDALLRRKYSGRSGKRTSRLQRKTTSPAPSLR